MIVKTDPSFAEVEEQLSGNKFNEENYKKAVGTLKEEGYVPKSILLKRRAIPGFQTRIPLKLLVDWEPQLDGADMVILLRKHSAKDR